MIRIKRALGLMAPILLATMASFPAGAQDTQDPIEKPEGVVFRDPFIGRDGVVTDTDQPPPDSLEFRDVIVDREGGIVQPDVPPPRGAVLLPPFIDPQGEVVRPDLPAPDGVVFRVPFIGRDGAVMREEVAPPTGIKFRPLFMDREGVVRGTPAPPVNPRQKILQGSLYPNPFNPGVQLSFRLGVSAHTVVRIFDLSGRKVRTLHEGPLAADLHVLRWDGLDDTGQGVASGLYLVRIEAAGEVLSVKGALLK